MISPLAKLRVAAQITLISLELAPMQQSAIG
jgi:hypothetical protein